MLVPALALVAIVLLIAYLAKQKLAGPTPSTTYHTAPQTAKASKPEKTHLVMYYGSQTGTAETFANQLVDEAKSRNLGAKSVDLEEFDEAMLKDAPEGQISVFLMATYGEGDPTDNAVEFMKWLSEVPDEQDLSNIKFTVFALGNRQYEKFNKAGTDTDKFLLERGATRVFPLGLGDDDCDIEGDFEKWKENIWPELCKALGVECEEPANNSLSRPAPAYSITTHPNTNPSVNWKPNSNSLYDQHHPFETRVLVNTELYSSDRSCRHIELTTQPSVTYNTGDHLAILPDNPPKLVETLASRLNISLDTVVSLSSPDGSTTKVPFHGQRVKTGDVIASCIDLTCVVPHNTIAHLASFANDEREKAELERMGKKEGKGEYTAKIQTPMLIFGEVLDKYKSINMTLSDLLTIAPHLHPRFYSISSSHMRDPKNIHLCVAVVEYDKPNGRHHDGVCSTYLQKLQISSTARAFVRRSTFHPPADPSVPLLLIGPGTGLAPFRGFIHDRECLLQQGKKLGECVLYYGTRYSEKEFLYKEDLEHAVASGAISTLHTAVSRDDPKNKVYVQHLLRQHAESIRALLAKGAMVYVCGLVEMSRDVVDALCDVLGEGDRGRGERDWEQIKDAGRFKTDVWS